MKFGALLPHFGEHASVERLLDGAQRLEALGFHSVWVRDHLVWTPHEMEGTDQTFVEPLLTLASVGAVTERLVLGTAVLIPLRWPLKVAQNLASLSWLTGGRVMGGFGLGGNPVEFSAAGLDPDHREAIFQETLEICREVWERDEVSYRGEVFSFQDVTIRPKPMSTIPLLYGGSTRASVRRAVAHTEGWLPGRIPLATLDDRLELLEELSTQAGKSLLRGIIPLVRIAEDRELARKGINVDALATSSHGATHWIKPPSGEFRTIEDLEGLLIAGDPDDCRRELQKLVAREIDLVVLDFRLDFGRYMEQVELFASEVMPHFPDPD